MIRRLGVALVALATLTAGCVGSSVPGIDDEEVRPGNATDGLPVEAPPAEARGLEDPPTLREGEWWTVQVTSDLYGVDEEAQVVAAGVEDDRYMLGMPSGDFVHAALILHIPGLGAVHRSSFAYEAHDQLFEPVQFPLEAGQSWTTDWYTGEMEAQVAEVGNGTARAELVGSNVHMNVTYEAGLGIPKAVEIDGYGSYEVTDHGYGFEGNVTVPWNRDIIFLNGRVAGAVDLSQSPGPPVESIEVEGPYDGSSIALLLGNAFVEGPPGVYRVAAESPEGTVFEETFVPSPGGAQLSMVPEDGGDPTGTWQAEYEAGGAGIAAIEGIGYDVRRVSVG